MLKTYRKKRIRNHPRVVAGRILSRWPLYVWIVAILVAFILYERSSQFGGMQGVVETFEEPVSPLETARLQELFVIRGQRVNAGDAIAQMDTAQLDTKMAVDQAKILEAQGTLSGYQQDVMDIIRQFNDNIRDAESDLEEERISLLKDTAELNALNTELERREGLREKNLLSEKDISELRPRMAALQVGLDTYPRLISLKEDRLTEISTQRDALFEWMKVEKSGTFSDAVKEEMKARAAILDASMMRRHMQRKLFTLRAARGGVVSRIFHEPGSVVKAGDPVVLVVSEKSEWVVGFLPEIYVGELADGQEAHVERKSGRGEMVQAKIQAISPEIRSLPGRISPIRNQPLRGRRVMIRLEQDDVFIPGETVKVTFPFRFRSTL